MMPYRLQRVISASLRRQRLATVRGMAHLDATRPRRARSCSPARGGAARPGSAKSLTTAMPTGMSSSRSTPSVLKPLQSWPVMRYLPPNDEDPETGHVGDDRARPARRPCPIRLDGRSTTASTFAQQAADQGDPREPAARLGPCVTAQVTQSCSLRIPPPLRGRVLTDETRLGYTPRATARAAGTHEREHLDPFREHDRARSRSAGDNVGQATWRCGVSRTLVPLRQLTAQRSGACPVL